MIATLESVHGRALRAFASPLEFVIRKHWNSVDLPPWKAIASGRTVGKVHARVNHGRWIVDCPTEGCSESTLASETDRRFVCVSCAAGPYEVVWPSQHEAIDEALAERPQPNRNWFPGESVGDLRKENANRGKPADPGKAKRNH